MTESESVLLFGQGHLLLKKVTVLVNLRKK